jgi:NADH-quinone oxidoreductase subunit F
VKAADTGTARNHRYNCGFDGGDLGTASEDAGRAEGAELIRRLQASGLRGRGGGWFPAARKWQAVRAEGGEPLVIGNGAEGEPGSVKDRWVMLTRPREVIRGLVLAARGVGAREAVVYLKGSFAAPAAALQRAASEEPLQGVTVTIGRGDDGYIAGEETAVIEVLEGRRAWPRPKPPLPAAVGFRGRPTLVQNVETLSRVPPAIADPEGFRAAESTLVSLWGHVRRPGVYEVALGTPLRRIVEDRGGGAPDGVGMVFPAGPSAPPLAAGQLDAPLHPDALREAGSALGTAALLVVGASVCPLSVGSSLAAFFEREACGQCPPCTVGTSRLAGALRAIEAGAAQPADLDALAETAGFMSMHGYCAHCRTAAAAVPGLLARFREDVAAHLEARGCARGGTPCDPFASGSPERRAIEAAIPSP